MKYKITGIITFAVAALVTLILALTMREDDGKRYIQHMEKEIYKECKNHTSETFCTHLPIMQIDTGGVDIPGVTVHDREKNITTHSLAADGSTTIAAKTVIIDGENKNNHLTDDATISSDIRIRIRGNSSRHFDKKPYLVELINPDGTKNPQAVMGMAAHHEWALHGPYLDKTLIRNYMWYNIAGQIMDYAPNVRFFELFLNGEYQGVYLMTETITSGEEGARIQLSVDKKDNSFTGYILRHDRGSDNELKNIEPFSLYSMRSDKKINVVYPGAGNLTKELARSIELDFSQFEKAIYSYDFDDKKKGYKGTIDVDSFVDYFIINEVTLNRDAGLYSTYVYKDTDGKYRTCVWDFNNALDNYEDVENPPYGFAMYETLWFTRIIQDEDFTERIVERYRELRKTVLSSEYLDKFIDDTIKYLGKAVYRNYEKWGYSFEEQYGRLRPKNRNPRNYPEAVVQMRDCLTQRLKWLDENIESIKQYSAPSKTRESHEFFD